MLLPASGLPPVPALDPVLAFRIRLTHHHREPKVGSQLVVTIQVLIAQISRIRFLRQQTLNRMFDPLLFPVVGETSGKLLKNFRPLLDFPQQQSNLAAALARRWLPSNRRKGLPFKPALCIKKLLVNTKAGNDCPPLSCPKLFSVSDRSSAPICVSVAN